jgi:hypothetical protein
MTGPICELDQIRELLRDLERALGVGGSFRPRAEAPTAELESAEKIEELFRELLVGVFGMEVSGL